MLRNMDKTYGYDVVVIMAGGNDLDAGAKWPYFNTTYNQIAEEAQYYGVKKVVITSIWPRWDKRFNSRARQLEEQTEERFKQHSRVTYWSWDKRQSYVTYDGVHLRRKGYEKAITYLLAPILWIIKRLQR